MERMSKFAKKLVAFALVLVMVIGMVPSGVFAEENQEATEDSVVKLSAYLKWEVKTTSGSTDDSSEPSEDPSEPSGDPSEPSGDTSEPSEDPSEPSGDPSEPSEDPSEPSGDPSEPSGDPSEPSGDPSEPSEDSSEASESAPLTREATGNEENQTTYIYSVVVQTQVGDEAPYTLDPKKYPDTDSYDLQWKDGSIDKELESTSKTMSVTVTYDGITMTLVRGEDATADCVVTAGLNELSMQTLYMSDVNGHETSWDVKKALPSNVSVKPGNDACFVVSVDDSEVLDISALDVTAKTCGKATVSVTLKGLSDTVYAQQNYAFTVSDVCNIEVEESNEDGWYTKPTTVTIKYNKKENEENLPQVTVTEKKGENKSDYPLSFTASETNPLTMELTFGNNGETKDSSTRAFGDGKYEVKFLGQIKNINVDTEDPTVKITSISTTSDGLTITATASDATSGLKGVSATVDGKTVDPSTAENAVYTFIVAGDSYSKVEVTAKDNAGREGTATNETPLTCTLDGVTEEEDNGETLYLKEERTVTVTVPNVTSGTFNADKSKVTVDGTELNNWSVDDKTATLTIKLTDKPVEANENGMNCLTAVSVDLFTTDGRSLSKSLLKENTKLIVDTKAPVLTLSASVDGENNCDVAMYGENAFVLVPTVEDGNDTTNEEIEVTVTGQIEDENFNASCYEPDENSNNVNLTWNAEGTKFTYKVTVKAGEAIPLPLPNGVFNDLAGNLMEAANFIGTKNKNDEVNVQAIEVKEGKLTGEIFVDRKSPDNDPEDDEAPSITLKDVNNETVNGIYTSETIKFEVVVSDNDSGLRSIEYWTGPDGTHIYANEDQEIEINVGADVEQDGFQIYVCATDNVGNSRTVMKEINVDTKVPVVTFSRTNTNMVKNDDEKTDYFNGSVTYTVTVTDLHLSPDLKVTVDEEEKALEYSSEKTMASFSVTLNGTENNMENGNILTSISLTATDAVKKETTADLSGATVSLTDTESETDDGYKKEVDTAAPSIEISSTKGTPGEAKWTVTVTPKDVNFDESKSYVKYTSTKNGEETTVEFKDGKYVIELESPKDALDSNEQLESLSICIVDYAGNYGTILNPDESPIPLKEDENSTGVWVLKSVVENDTVVPDIDISDLGTPANTNKVNDISYDYYNEEKSIIVTVKDKNLDLGKTTITYTLNGESITGELTEDKEQKGVYYCEIKLQDGHCFENLKVHAEDNSGNPANLNKEIHAVIDTTAPVAEIELSCEEEKNAISGFYTNEKKPDVIFVKLNKDKINIEELTLNLKVTVTDNNIRIWNGTGEQEFYVYNALDDEPSADNLTAESTGKITYTDSVTVEVNKEDIIPLKLYVADLVGNQLEEATVQTINNFTYKPSVSNGTISNIFSLDRKPATLGDEDAPNVVLRPTKDPVVTLKNGVALYDSSFSFNLTVRDATENQINNSNDLESAAVLCSGLETVSWEVTDGKKVVNEDSENRNYPDDIQYKDTFEIPITLNGTGESNEVTVTVSATDNSGNTTTYVETIAVDNLAPRVTVSYDNNEVQNDKYFKADRTATITVEDINFDATTNSTITTEGAEVSVWQLDEKTGKWTANCEYTNDGEYTLEFSCADLADHTISANKDNNAAVTVAEDTKAPWEFIVDQIAPKCTVTISPDKVVNTVDNTDYYDGKVTIKISITDDYINSVLLEKCKKSVTWENSKTGTNETTTVDLSWDDETKAAGCTIELNGLGSEYDDPTEHGDILSALSIVFQDPAGNDVEISDGGSWKENKVNKDDSEFVEWEYDGNNIEVDNTPPKIVEIIVPENPNNSDDNVDYYNKTQKVTVTVQDINLNLDLDPNKSEVKYGLGSGEETAELKAVGNGVYQCTIDVVNGQEFKVITVKAVDYCKNTTDEENKSVHFVVDATAPTADITLSCKDEYKKELVDGFYTNINDPNVIFVKLNKGFGNIEEATLNLTVTVKDNNIRVWSETVEDHQDCYVYNALDKDPSSDNLTGESTGVNTETTITYTDSVKVKVDKEGIISLKLHVADLAGNQVEKVGVQIVGTSTYIPVIETDNGVSTGIINNIFSLDRRAATSVEDENNPPCLILTPDKEKVGTIKNEDNEDNEGNEGIDLYDSSFEFKLTVRDATDAQIENKNYLESAAALCSGLNEVKWQVTDKNGVVKVDKQFVSKTYSNGTYLDNNITIPITLENEKGESNEITINVSATDNNGNTTEYVKTIAVDNLAPRVTVAYSNNNVQNGKYFKADRIATITVKDINFNAETTKVTTQVPISKWKETSPDVWVATSTYSQDGDYTFQMESTDRAGNKTASADVNYAGSAPNEFTIDKTAPVITVTYNNNSSMNGKYYNAGRIGSITIREHNFASKDFRSAITASLDGVGIAVPTVNGWSRSGDNNGASVNFTADGDYTMKLDYTDLAGNPATTYTESPFTVDTVIPEIEISMDDYSANSGTVAPEVTITDINFDANGYSIPVQVLQGLNAGAKTYNWSSDSSSIRNGVKVSFVNIQKVKDNDGVYILTAKVTDLAGNENTQRVTFSVNRFGSTYIAYDQATKDLLESGYSKSAPTVCIQEINPNAISNNKVVLSVGGDTFTLVQGTDYTVDATTGKDCWNGALYTISSDVFMKNGELAEGAYELQFYSNDEAKNSNSNRSNEGGLSVRFTLDDSAPVVSITGISNGDRIRAEARDITLFYSDSSGIREIIIYLDGEEYVRLSEEDIAANPNSYLLTIDQSNSDRKLSVVIVDAAGNELRTDDITFFLNGSIFQQYLHNTPLLIGSIVGVVAIAALIVFLIKRKKKQSAQ